MSAPECRKPLAAGRETCTEYSAARGSPTLPFSVPFFYCFFDELDSFLVNANALIDTDKGENVLCDAGTYSYNPPPDEDVNLKSVNHHNTVSFEGNEQMPQLSRFLLGNWLKADHTGSINQDSSGMIEWTGSYYDSNKNYHQRKIISGNNIWIIEDTLEGDFTNARIGFNINYQKVVLEGREVFFPGGRLTVDENVIAILTDSTVSEYYFEKHAVKRLMVEVSKPGTYKTVLSFN